MKRIILTILSAHIVLLLWMALWMPTKKERSKKPIQVRMLTQAPSPPKPSAPTPLSPPLPKKTVAPIKKAPVDSKPKPQKPTIPNALLKELQESIAKIEKSSHKESPTKHSPLAKRISTLQIDEGEESLYAEHLIRCLQNALELPEVGAVKLELTLKCDGTFVQVRILQSANPRNQKFLETQLHLLKYPSFNGHLRQEKEHTFAITFCNS